MNIYVGNLSDQTTENQLQDLFAQFGQIKSLKIITDNFTKRPRGFAFVEMHEKEEGVKAIETLHNSMLNQQFITVNEARERNNISRSDSNKDFNRRF